MSRNSFPKAVLRFVFLFLAVCGASGVRAQTNVGQETLVSLPSKAQWERAINFVPANNEMVSINPPHFQWCYATNISTFQSDKTPKTFILQVAYDSGFQNLAVNVTTPWNFYSTMAPFTNSVCYWRVGYIQGLNPTGQTNGFFWSILAGLPTNVYYWSPTYTFSIMPNAQVWDRSMMADPTYLANKAQHPYIFINAASRSNINAWLTQMQTAYSGGTTNRLFSDIGKGWKNIQASASQIITNSWWPGTIPTNVARGTWASDVYTVALMWVVTQSPVWSNAQPQQALGLVANDYMTNALGNYSTDPIYSSIAQLEGRALALGYDWCYDLLTPVQQSNILYSLASRCRYIVMGSDLVWFEGNPPFYNTTPDPTGQYNTGYLMPTGGTLATYGASHASDDFYLAMLQALAGYNEHPWCADLFNMGVNYMLGPTYCYYQEMGNARPYTAVHMGTDRMLVTHSMFQSVFPEAAWTNNPFILKAADWWDHIEPVAYAFTHEPWGDCSYGDLEDWEVGQLGRNMAVFTGSPTIWEHWWNQENFFMSMNHGPYLDDASTILLPYWFNCNVPLQPTTNLAVLYTNEGWMITSSTTPSTVAGFSNGVGIVLQARPAGSEMGHTHLSDGSFQMWAYGAPVTDASGDDTNGSQCAYAKVPWAHNVLMVNGLGEDQPDGEETFPYYCRFIAFTNNDAFTYCAVDLTHAYAITNIGSFCTGWLLPQQFVNLHQNGPLYNLTNVTRQLLFNRKKYLVIYDTMQMAGPPTNTFSWVYHILPPTLNLNTNNMSFNYTTPSWLSHSNVTVYVQQVVNPAELTVYNMSGTNADVNYRMNPFTGENYWTNLTGDFGDKWPQANVLWFNNAQPTNSFHFMTVIYPVPPGGSIPQITPLDDYTVAITNGAEGDVITFNTNTSYTPTLMVNAIGSPGSIVQILSPPSNLRITQ